MPPGRERQGRYRITPKGCYTSYKGAAKRRKIAFSLSYAKFLSFWRQPCFYCHFKIKTVGLDRVDNSRGYVPDNVVSCCRYCNYGKSTLTQTQFLGLCANVVRVHGLVYAQI